MTDDVTLRTLEELFHRAVALPEKDRDSFLKHECSERPSLRAQLERMIQADRKASGIPGSHVSEAATEVEPGRFIGRWQLLERIGCGGLGVVYRATCEADGVTIQAAVKILRMGLGVLVHRCFIQERIILAGLDHPYIARLIDAGVDPCGKSFMAMEFVAGLVLDDHLEQRQSALIDRLKLFNRICEAISYLHDNGIVHGDLKPSNIVVTHGGLPKLLDFGTACFVNPGDASEDLTALMMTPAYASPEQLAGSGPSVSGDVYSLGCILRELLDRKSLCRDLSAILDKCLASSPSARYSSPREIALEIGRYLDHRPVQALAGQRWYVTRKFVRRNRTACGLAGLVVLSLIAGWIVSHNNMARAQEYAEQHRSVVARLVRFDPGPRSPEIQALTAYAAGVEDLVGQMERKRPLPLADLTSAWRSVAYSQATRGQTPQSIASIQRSIWYARRNVRSSDTAEARSQLAESLLHAVILHQRRGDKDQAVTAAIEAIQLVDTLPVPIRTAIGKRHHFIRALGLAGMQRALAGDIDNGRTLLKRALELGRAMGQGERLRRTLDLVRFERIVKQPERATAWCAEAQSLGIKTARLQRLCLDTQSAGPADREAALARHVSGLERRLAVDPERYGKRLQLARMHWQLARVAAGKGDHIRASQRVQQARALTSELLQADPDNLRLRHLLQRIERGIESGWRPQVISTGTHSTGGSPESAVHIPER